MLRRLLLLLLILCSALTLASCDSGSNTTTTNPPAAKTPVRTAVTVNSRIHTAKLTVDGKDVTVLTDVNGMTLYYYKKDTDKESACTGGCADTWPALRPVDSASLMSSEALPGKLTVVATTNGNQIAYNGHLLYTYKSDATGQAKGQGIGDQWAVATTDLQ